MRLSPCATGSMPRWGSRGAASEALFRESAARLRPAGFAGHHASPFGRLVAAPREARRAKRGGARRDRTADLLHAMQALSQLSYGPLAAWRMIMPIMPPVTPWA